jgi:cytochrome o ubiquinol oxidase operon protein cyoD
MNGIENDHGRPAGDATPGYANDGDVGVAQSIRGYVIGLAFAAALTAASLYVAQSTLIWAPGIPVALIVLAVAQMGVHLVFFLRITTGPEHTNNVLALAFGILIVILVVGGSLWIMANLNYNMMSMDQLMRMQR